MVMRAETGYWLCISVSTQPLTRPQPAVADPAPGTADVAHLEGFDHIACRGCGWRFPAPEGAAMLFALKGSCPSCGGEFELILGND